MKKKRKNIKKGVVLVLGGGVAKGLAHIGILEVLEENKIPISGIIGSSSGALIGGIYCAGNLTKLKEIFLKLTKMDLLMMLGCIPYNGHILTRKRLDKIIKPLSDIEINKLSIPFGTVGFDATKNKILFIDRGNLYIALMASISIPGFFEPLKKGNHTIIDGGLIDLMPIDFAKKKFAKSKIIAVNVDSLPKLDKKCSNTFELLSYEEELKNYELAKLQEKDADIIIDPDIKEKLFEFDKAEDIIKQGRIAAKKSISKIKKILK